ncbi:hypothetical protein Tsp_02332 [Trichinella spiralis]|uniref:hypothetical protein n=1 Tax=Trichinella spiralis TaxID=6334 RepID=UPI0001EFCEAE|nr:hypothetical protein Tsp_02332 [Trichinella spiralis]
MLTFCVNNRSSYLHDVHSKAAVFRQSCTATKSIKAMLLSCPSELTVSKVVANSNHMQQLSNCRICSSAHETSKNVYKFISWSYLTVAHPSKLAHLLLLFHFCVNKQLKIQFIQSTWNFFS